MQGETGRGMDGWMDGGRERGGREERKGEESGSWMKTGRLLVESTLAEAAADSSIRLCSRSYV